MCYLVIFCDRTHVSEWCVVEFGLDSRTNTITTRTTPHIHMLKIYWTLHSIIINIIGRGGTYLIN